MLETKTIRPEKQEAVAQIVEKLSSAKSVFVTDYSGLTVAAITNLRRNLRKSKVEFQVSKNTLARIAAQQAGLKDLVPHLEGPTALAFGMGDPAAPAKVLTDFLKTNEKPKVKAIVFEGRYFEAKSLAEIATLPSREQLMSRLLGSLNSPITGLANALSGIIRKLAYALNAVAESKEKSEA
ncbi:MAG: 50S ribosomal protein L10 [candidate division KSB1 bacterium]